MKKDILLIAHFVSDFDGRENIRLDYLANYFANNGFEVELVTSDFSHNNKEKRKIKVLNNLNYKVTFISEPPYKKNVSIKRFYSHYVMGRNLKKYLNSRKKPSLIYCAVPSLDIADTAAKYATQNNIRFIIDIQDLWPEAFQMVFNFHFISNLIFYPLKRKANNIYQSADQIVAVSQTYNIRALEVNRKTEQGLVVFLGTELKKFDDIPYNHINKNKPDDEIWIAYVGTLGHSYDLTIVFDALEILNSQGYNHMKFIIMGDGPLKEKFEAYADKKKLNTLFTGRLPYTEMVGLLKTCDIAVNPITKGAAQSIINKHADYAAAGLPVLNTQENFEYRDLVEEYKMGLNCNNNDASSLAEKLILLLTNEDLRREMGNNSRKLAEEKFDRIKTYRKIMNFIIRRRLHEFTSISFYDASKRF